MRKIEIQEISTGELFAKFEAIIKDTIKGVKVGVNNESLRLFTREETAKLLKVSLPTLNSWAKKGVLVPMYLGSRVYYSKMEIKNKLNLNR